ncbi:MAG: Beta-barrel assembly-enhancing protease [Planctomycetes bacterium]|nr:Beta-barrel assembly-enhancing protease [Planctomycetota bacterium]
MTETPETPRDRQTATVVRCYLCATRGLADADECAKCGATFLAVCVCGARGSVFESDCAACGRRRGAKRLPMNRHPGYRAAKIALLVLGVAAVAGVLWRRSHRPLSPWALKEQAATSFRDGRFSDAIRELQQVIEMLPGDRDAWADLAVSMHNAGLPPESVLGPVRKAHSLSPRSFRVTLLRASVELAAGNRDAARALALDCTRLPLAPPEAFLLFAELELGRPSPDMVQVIDVLTVGRNRHPRSAPIRILLAECHVNSIGVFDPSAYSADALAAIADAESSFSALDRTGMPKEIASVLEARLLLSKGSFADAYSAASRGLDALLPDARDSLRATLESLAGQSIYLWQREGNLPRDHFARALKAKPDLAVATEIEHFLSRQGDWRMSEHLFAANSPDADPHGALAAALALSRLQRGAFAEAAEAVAAARLRNPSDASILLLEGDVRAARGDTAGAIAAWELAKHSPGAAVPAAIRRALATMSDALAITDAAERERILNAEVVRLEGLRDPSAPSLPLEVGRARLLLAAGRHEDALAGVEFALRRSAPTSDAWLVVAEARSAGGNASEAASAIARARSLRPSDPALYRLEALAMASAGDASAAFRAASRGLALQPGNTDLLALRADCALQLRLLEDAARDLEALDAALPGNAATAQRLGEALLILGRRARAREILDGALEKVHGEGRAALERLRRLAEGATAAEAVDALRGDGPSAVLAELLYATGQIAQAAETARAVLGVTPGDPLATAVAVLAELDLDGGTPESAARARPLLAGISPSSPADLRGFLEGRVLLAERKFREARQALDAIERWRANDGVYWFLRAEAAFLDGDRPAAIAAYRRAAAFAGLPPAIPQQMAVRLARCALDEKDPRAAELLARQAIQLDRGCAPATLRAAEVLLARGEAATALALLTDALSPTVSADADRCALHQAAAAAAAAMGDSSATLLHAAAARSLGAGDVHVAALEAAAHLVAGREPDAEAAIALALAANPGDLSVRRLAIRIRLRRPETADGAVADAIAGVRGAADQTSHVVDLARAFAERQRFSDAVRILDAAREENPSEMLYADFAVQFSFSAGDPAGAAARAAAWAASRPRDDARALLLAGMAQASQPDPAAREAGIAALAALESAPGTPSPIAQAAASFRAQSLLVLGRKEDAREAAEAVLRVRDATGRADPVRSRCLHVAGVAAALMDDTAAATTHLAQAVAVQPNDPELLNNAAWVLSKSPQHAQRAFEYADRAARAVPQSPNYWDTRGTAALAAGKFEDAIASWQQALRIHATVPELDPGARARTAMRLSDALHAAGQPEASRAAAAQVLQFQPAPPADLAERAREAAARQ